MNTAQSTKIVKPMEQKRIYGVYMRSVLTTKTWLHITEIGGDAIKKNLEKKISSTVEGKCIPEGYIRPKSVNIIKYSNGKVVGELIEFHVVYECDLCYPVEGMNIDCTTKTITKAGIHAEVIDKDGNIPITIFIARDHQGSNKYFNEVSENQSIKIRVIGVRFELNDPYICVISKLLMPAK